MKNMSKVEKGSGYGKKGEKKKKKLSFEDGKTELLKVRKRLFNKLVVGEKENVLMRLVVKFKGLRYEDLEEVYDDGCLVLWVKMMDEDFELREESLIGFLIKICWNVGMHYLRKVDGDVLSLDMMMGKRVGCVENGMEEMFEVLSEKENDEEKYKKLENVWVRLKDVERMILVCYYVEGCKMEEIAKRIGYKNGNSVKSKKNRVLRKMMNMMKEEGAEDLDLPSVA